MSCGGNFDVNFVFSATEQCCMMPAVQKQINQKIVEEMEQGHLYTLNEKFSIRQEYFFNLPVDESVVHDFSDGRDICNVPKFATIPRINFISSLA